MTTALSRIHDIADMREAARRRLPRGLFEFIDRGTGSDLSARNNIAAFDRVRLLPRPLVNITQRTTGCEVMGTAHTIPLAVAPTGTAGLVWHRGEVALARAAAAAGVPFTLATRSLTAIETVAKEAGGTLWFQLYPSRDEPLSARLLERARNAGFSALVVTVDTPAVPRRVHNERNGFSLNFRLTPRFAADAACHPRWLLGTMGGYMLKGGLPRFENLPERPTILAGAGPAGMLDGALDWAMVERLRAIWPGKLIVKGILRAEDARRCLALGSDAIVVSNHGGRNLDCVPAPIELLPEIVDAVGTRMTVLLDSGIRRGSDIAKACALGADGVLVGRSTLYGCAVAGEAGAAHALELLRMELDSTLAMLGCLTIGGLAAHRADDGPRAAQQ